MFSRFPAWACGFVLLIACAAPDQSAETGIPDASAELPDAAGTEFPDVSALPETSGGDLLEVFALPETSGGEFPDVSALPETSGGDLLEVFALPETSGGEFPDVFALPDAAETDADAELDVPDAAAPSCMLPALIAALQTDDAATIAVCAAQYDMPMCDATQCLFLVVAPGAKTVAVDGEWSGWTVDTPLTYAPKAAVWWAVFPLQVGKKLEYKVKLDGVWALDPSNPHFAWNTYGPNSAIYGVNQSRLRRIAAIASPQLSNIRDVYVYLPAAYYQQPDAHFPVLYLQDGFNIYTNPKAPFGSWNIEQTADALMASGEVLPVIFVGIDTADRDHEYVYAPLDIAGTTYDPKLPQYTAFLTDTLKPLVDKLLRTLPDRLHTAMGGSSLGGISSLWIGWTQWQTFGLVASFSGAYWIGEPGAVWNGGKSSVGPAMRTLIADKAKAPPVGSLKIYMDSGDTDFSNVVSYDGDAWEYSDWTRNALIAAGWDTRAEWQPTTNLPLTTPIAQVPSIAWTATPAQGWVAYLQPSHNLFDCVGHGQQHNEAAWSQRFGAMLRFLWPGPNLK